jgi:hypothetical protein
MLVVVLLLLLTVLLLGHLVAVRYSQLQLQLQARRVQQVVLRRMLRQLQAASCQLHRQWLLQHQQLLQEQQLLAAAVAAAAVVELCNGGGAAGSHAAGHKLATCSVTSRRAGCTYVMRPAGKEGTSLWHLRAWAVGAQLPVSRHTVQCRTG